jgi:tetratricopeptide (TPR) repeat protein
MKNVFSLLLVTLLSWSLFSLTAIADNTDDFAQKSFIQGNELFQKGDYENALSEYQKALNDKNSKNHPEVLFNKSMALYKLGRTAQADAVYLKFIQTEYERVKGSEEVPADLNMDRSLFENSFFPEHQAWFYWAAKYIIYVLAIVLIFSFFSLASDGSAMAAFLFVLPITVGVTMTGYYL